MVTHKDVANGKHPWVIVERAQDRSGWDAYTLVDALPTVESAREEKRRLESDPQLCFTGKLEILYYVE